MTKGPKAVTNWPRAFFALCFRHELHARATVAPDRQKGDPLRTMVMASQEFEPTPEESFDPLSEDSDSAVPCLVHAIPIA